MRGYFGEYDNLGNFSAHPADMQPIETYQLLAPLIDNGLTINLLNLTFHLLSPGVEFQSHSGLPVAISTSQDLGRL
jgi:hypothetical protein